MRNGSDLRRSFEFEHGMNSPSPRTDSTSRSRFLVNHIVGDSRSWGNDSVSQRGSRGLEFTTELAESRAGLDELGRVVPQFTISVELKSGGLTQ